ncbi:hypothetical protein HNY73_007249 [Argiope bruennichi]|uniref:Uncharacterized protein n=1 Tax=Argiope bruennichi TaxID=94029 RepID=A0A8T0FFX2_ARGBR|nr:hypothetical protein HNY73_007249 [Argiope bruennichi]
MENFETFGVRSGISWIFLCMPWTRGMDEKFAELLAMMAEMNKGQEEMKVGLEKKLESGLDEMWEGQKKLKNQIQVHVESQVKRIKDHVNSCIEKIEDVQSVEREIGEVRDEVRTNIEAVQESIGNLEKRLSELEDRPNNFIPSPEFSYTRPTVKPLTFDRQTSWTVFKTQFDVVSSTNGWTDV